MDFIPSDKAISIRMPSTANLLIDSTDRNTAVYPNPYDFTIQQNQSILNGFFTRIGATEVVLNWNQPNISAELNNNSVNITVATTPTPTTHLITIQDGFYTAYELLTALCAEAERVFTGYTFNLGTKTIPNGLEIFFVAEPGDWCIDCALTTGNVSSDFTISEYSDNSLYDNLNVSFNDDTPAVLGYTPDLRITRYIDFVSPSLTYCQKLKDGTSNTISKDVLCRFYFATDTPQLDAGGLLQYVGYTPFNIWRQFNPPKQIKFDPNLPIGQLSFQVYDSNNNLIPIVRNNFSSIIQNTDWQMTLQVSEV